MPELPEVEHVRRSLAEGLIGRTIAAATVHRRDVLVAPGDPDGGFSRQRSQVRPVRFDRALLLVGSKVTSVDRRGKQLAMRSDRGHAVLGHLGMTGSFRLLAPGERAAQADHVHVTWRLEGGGRLCFRDPRRFGGLWLVPTEADLSARWARLGPDALAITPDQLSQALAGARTPLKAALLDQTRLAGLGNIYVDEANHLARLHPARVAGSLSPPEHARLATAIRAVLQAAVVAGGSTLRDYRDPAGQPGAAQNAHRVYARGGRACTDCGESLHQTVIAQRTTVYCARCQA